MSGTEIHLSDLNVTSVKFTSTCVLQRFAFVSFTDGWMDGGDAAIIHIRNRVHTHAHTYQLRKFYTQKSNTARSYILLFIVHSSNIRVVEGSQMSQAWLCWKATLQCLFACRCFVRFNGLFNCIKCFGKPLQRCYPWIEATLNTRYQFRSPQMGASRIFAFEVDVNDGLLAVLYAWTIVKCPLGTT